jgi:competence CoiA-like predicted nuclease
MHRADVHTDRGVTIEFQNSFLSIEELESREKFYAQLKWVVNGLKFKKRFTFTHNIADPNDPLLENFEIAELVFLKKEEILQSSKDDLLRVYGKNDPELKD